jgi:hypothetical protein
MAIQLSLEPQEVELVLSDLSEKKINERIGLWMKIREQALIQLQTQQSAANAEADKAPADA